MPRILYVEDEPPISDLVLRWLREDDLYEVVHTDDGPTALELAASSAFDLILLDIRLGPFSIDGWEINRRLKENPATASIPTICFTAEAQTPEHRERAAAEGFVTLIGKPFSREPLLDCIAAHLPEGGSP